MAGAMLTTAAANKVAAFATGGPMIQLAAFAVGDANGVPYDPNPAQAALVGERWRGAIASVGALGAGTFVIECVLPANLNDGNNRPSYGFNVAELGIYDATGALFAVARLGNGYKPSPASGQAEDITFEVQITVANANAVTVLVDPNSAIHIGRLSRLGWITVEDVRDAPPLAPAMGVTFAIAAAPTGAWAGHAGEIAQWLGDRWVFKAVPLGHIVNDTSKLITDPARYMHKVIGGWETVNASETRIGFVRAATAAETYGGQDRTLAVTPWDTAKARQQNWFVYGPATGTANALIANLTPPPLQNEIVSGMDLLLEVSQRNTGPATLAIGGSPDVAPIVYNDTGEALAAGALLPGQQVRLTRCFVGGVPYWRLHRPQSRIIAQAALTLYVRSDGNDLNDGAANTAAGAFATIQAAFDYAKRRLDIAGASLTIKLGLAGSYAGAFFDNAGMQGPITIEGDTAAEANYLITLAPAVAGRPRHCIGTEIPLVMVRGATLDVTGGAGATYATWVTAGGRMQIGPHVTIQIAGNNTDGVLFAADAGGVMSYIGAITLTSGALRSMRACWQVTSGGKVLGANAANPATITISNLEFSTSAVAVCSGGSELNFASVTLAGTTYGPRYLATLNGVINTNGGGANFIFGNTAGSTASGGQYV
ncbi:MAG: phage tail protein [Candidatus Competibacter phosphatis]